MKKGDEIHGHNQITLLAITSPPPPPRHYACRLLTFFPFPSSPSSSSSSHHIYDEQKQDNIPVQQVGRKRKYELKKYKKVATKLLYFSLSFHFAPSLQKVKVDFVLKKVLHFVVESYFTCLWDDDWKTSFRNGMKMRQCALLYNLFWCFVASLL